MLKWPRCAQAAGTHNGIVSRATTRVLTHAVSLSYSPRRGGGGGRRVREVGFLNVVGHRHGSAGPPGRHLTLFYFSLPRPPPSSGPPSLPLRPRFLAGGGEGGRGPPAQPSTAQGPIASRRDPAFESRVFMLPSVLVWVLEQLDEVCACVRLQAPTATTTTTTTAADALGRGPWLTSGKGEYLR